MTLAAFDGKTLLLLGALLVAAFYTLRSAKRANPQTAPAPAVELTPKPAKCAVTGCTYPAYWVVTRRGFNTTERVCTGCYHEGDAWGWWK
jgi:hypothetical protein